MGSENQIEQIILPVRGKGLWSTMYGFLALSPSLEDVKGLSFYKHGETPGLGGEIDNPSWKAQFPGKKIFSENGEPMITVLKGKVNPQDPMAKYQVDGLSGATITSNGVANLLKFWLGEEGFGHYFDKLKAQSHKL
jgi:Na+-transporting NADH:ubiquinone oxidoreductase subunit C